MQILAADIGGTYARFALVRLDEDDVFHAGVRATYPSSELEGWRDGVERFLREADTDTVDGASMAVAGPVGDGTCQSTHLDWRIRAQDVSRLLDTDEVRLLNDFEALGFVLPLLTEDDCTSLQAGAARTDGLRVLLGAGTGLGQALVVPRNAGRIVDVHPTEGGHAAFAARTQLEWDLKLYLAERHGRASWEHVLSGPGLHAIYDFLVETGRFLESPATRAAMRDVDPGVVVSRQAIQGNDPACVRALDIFVSAYGARAGDLALTTGATGGVYLAGGIAMELRDELRDRGFLSAFLDKGRMKPWLEEIPVRVIARPDAGLMGAALAVLEPEARERVAALPPLAA